MNYTHLTFEQRYHIDRGRRSNLSARVIALKIGVHPSTVYRELRRGARGRRVVSGGRC
jgi:IS30 family transposase